MMKVKSLLKATALLSTGALLLTGCQAGRQSNVVANSKISVAWNDVYNSTIPLMVNTSNQANVNVDYLLSASSFYYDNKPELKKNEKFTKIEKISDSPLKVKYTINKDATWSDGAKITPADFLLTWVTQSTYVADDGKLGKDDTDKETGAVKNSDKTKDLALWNTGAAPDIALDLVKNVPTINDSENSITLEYAQPYTDWQIAFEVAPVAVHTLMQQAFADKYKSGKDSAEQANKDFVEAVKNKDRKVLAPASKVWREGFLLDSKPSAEELKNKFVTSGAYTIKDIDPGKYVTLEARQDYTWGEKPFYQTIIVKTIPDPQAQIQALQNGEVQIVAGQPTVDLLKQVQDLKAAKKVDFASSVMAGYEHLDLQTSGGGVFDPKTYGGDAEKAKKVRQAFFKAVPRQEIVDKLIKPLSPNATVRNSSSFLPGAKGYEESVASSGIKAYDKVDVEAAKKLLAEAGVTSPKVRLLFAKTNPRRNQEFELIQAAAKEAGFEVINASTEKWSAALAGKPDSYDAALYGWISTGLAATSSTGLGIAKDSPSNSFGWGNSETDELYKQIQAEPNEAKQQEILSKFDKIDVDEAWTLPIFQHPEITTWSTDVEGVQNGYLVPGYFWNYWNWKPKK